MSNAASEVIRLLLIDDHAMFREGLARMLDREAAFEIAGQVNSASEGLAILNSCKPDIVLLDVDLGAERALDFVKGSRAAGFGGRILVVTAGMSEQEAMQLVQSGISGILHKHHSTGVLCEAIRQVAGGGVRMEQAYLPSLFRAVDRTRKQKHAVLTDRDKTVMRGILQGLTNREIAGRLEVSEGAVKASVRHVCEKLHVRTRSQLVKVALEQYRDQL